MSIDWPKTWIRPVHAPDLPLPEGRLREGSWLDGAQAASPRDSPWDFLSIRGRGRYPGQPKERPFDLSEDPG